MCYLKNKIKYNCYLNKSFSATQYCSLRKWTSTPRRENKYLKLEISVCVYTHCLYPNMYKKIFFILLYAFITSLYYLQHYKKKNRFETEKFVTK